MKKTVMTTLKSRYLSQETLMNTTAMPGLVYFIYVCFPFARNNATLFLSFVCLATVVALGFSFIFWYTSLNSVRSVIFSDRSETLNYDALARAKYQAMKYPFFSAFSTFFRWAIIANLVAALPLTIITKMPLWDYFYMSLFLCLAGLSSMPYAFLNSESAISEFLRLQKISDVDIKDRNQWRLKLIPKIMLLVLMVLIPPIGNIIAVIFICSQNNISITSIKAGFIILILQALFLSILNSVMFAKSIKTAVDEVVLFLKEITQHEGDLTKTITVTSNDEVGELSTWFNKFIKNLRTMIGDIAKNAESLDTSSAELSKLSGDMSSGADEMSKQSNSVAEFSEEMSSNISSVAVTMQQAATNVEQVSAATEEMTATISEISKNSEDARTMTSKAVSHAESVSIQIDDLGKTTQDISNVTEIISEISEQTNLLALNATIESARAGDAGKGFAVVASEIKELAKQTTEAANEIRSRIEGIKNSTSGTIGQVDEIVKIINEVNEIVSVIASAVVQQTSATKEIAKNIVQASQGNREVNQNIAESSSVATNLARDISEVHTAAAKISNGSLGLNEGVEELSSLAERLNNMVGRFKL